MQQLVVWIALHCSIAKLLIIKAWLLCLITTLYFCLCVICFSSSLSSLCNWWLFAINHFIIRILQYVQLKELKGTIIALFSNLKEDKLKYLKYFRRSLQLFNESAHKEILLKHKLKLVWKYIKRHQIRWKEKG